MAGSVSEESGVGKSVEGISTGQRCQSGEALAEWRSSEQVENGITSTSPPYWDTDEDDDGGPRPSALYGKYTWKIEKFSQITKRELRSNIFEVGGYKWYILIYPQGCDVCNHLSLFLCVANHDKLLPGWSHFAQFTIAVVNKDPKKSKYSDTLHRFWKKEHDWGWKKFMELSKVYDGFVDASDNLIIKAQVQVIREKSDRPFRCLDCQYRRELVRVYLTNVEQICRRFVEERRSKLGKLIEDKARWSSFFAFWREIDQTSRRHMSREKMDVILKVVVKHFFIEKEVTSTLVMDSLYSGLKALEGQTKCKKGWVKMLDSEEIPAPIVRVEKDMFVLVDDVLLLLERAAIEPLPPKDEKGPQNRTKEGNSGEEFNKDSIERDERRLTELGRRTLEIFVLAHIFSNKIEVAYQEAVALKRQEELIREEEAAWQAESDQKTKRGVNDREKKSKKKQAKHKRNNKKGKDKGREERSTMVVHDKSQEDNFVDEKKVSNMEEAQTLSEKPDAMVYISDVSDSVDGVSEMIQPDSEDRDASPANWDTDASEVHPPMEASNNGIGGVSSIQNGMSDKRSNWVIDDSSSTCSTDSLPSVVMNDPYKGSSFSNFKFQKSPNRRKNRGKTSNDVGSWTNEIDSQLSGSAADVGDVNNESGSGRVGETESEGAVLTLQDRLKWAEQHVVRKEEETQKKSSIKGQVETDNESLRKEKISVVPSPPKSPPRNLSPSVQMKSENKISATLDAANVRKTSSSGSQQTDKDRSSPFTSGPQVTTMSKTDIQKTSTARSTERSVARSPVMSRPSSAPLVPGPRPTAPVVSMVQTAPPLARSVSAAGRLGPDPSPATHSYAPQSYRNAIMGNHVASTAANVTHSCSSNSVVNLSPAFSQSSSLVSSSVFLSQNSDRMDTNAGLSGVPFGMITRDVLQNDPQWIESSPRESSRNKQYDQPSAGPNDVQNHDLYRQVHNRSMSSMSSEFTACSSRRQNQVLLVDEFPHIDIINDLLDDEHGTGKTAKTSSVFESLNKGPQLLNRHFTFPGDFGANDDLRSSTSSCRFERSQSYHNDHGFQGGYSSSQGHFDSLRDYIPQVSSIPYANGQVGGLVPNQWQVPGSDLLYLGMRNTENDGYTYYPDYSNMACGVNGYTVFRPANGP